MSRGTAWAWAKSLHEVRPGGRSRTLADFTGLDGARRWREVLTRDPCAWCAGPGGTIDHVIPLSRGGSKGSPRNWVGSCPRCNAGRGAAGVLHRLIGVPDPAEEGDQPRSEGGGVRVPRGCRAADESGARRLPDEGRAPREAADRVMAAARAEIEAARAAWRDRWPKVKRTLYGHGHTAYDDPGAVQTARQTGFGTENDPAAGGPA